MMRNTFKSLFYLKKNTQKPDRNIPIMCRISIDGSITQFSCRIIIPLDIWDMEANKAKENSKKAQSVNVKLVKIRTGSNNCYQGNDERWIYHCRRNQKSLSEFRCEKHT